MREAAKELIWSGWPAIVLEPNDTLPMKVPVTRKPPTSSRCAMPLPQALSVPPVERAQSMTPDAVTCITNPS